MAAREKVNKSQAVRDFIKDNPKAANKEVAESLTKSGVKVTANYVASVKGKGKSKKRGRRAKKEAPVAAAVGGGNGQLGVSEIKLALSLLKATGGVKEARRAVDAAREIQKML
jgi:hypothetical protein